MFKIVTQAWKADEYYVQNVKRKFYRGKPTRKYRRYLNIQGGYSDEDVMLMENILLSKT
jgi:hypothetical protein